MKLTEYLGVSAEVLQDYINQGLVDTSFHPTFPLVIFTYSRKCVAEQAWDHVTRKCRGLIANTETDDIVARPFEKFFNYGDPAAGYPESGPVGIEPDTIYEKIDGFLCTLYEWQGKNYIASKGSFDSPHAKWATATYNNYLPAGGTWPKGYTVVFEGITKNLRIVVDYGDREELVLIGMVNIETGEELSHMSLMTWASANGFAIAHVYKNMKVADAAQQALNTDVKNFEGFVAYWSRPGETPFRLKIKYQDYLRIHRLVTGVSPKRVLEALQNGWTGELDEWTNESTPWFNHFIKKWRGVLDAKYTELLTASDTRYQQCYREAILDAQQNGHIWTRKEWAMAFKHEDEELHSILFARLDGKDVAPFIWKRVKPLISGSRPMIDATKM